MNRCIMIKSFLIASFTCKCIININNRYHLCGDWYFFTFQSIRIALSIPSFMMPPADFPCGMYQWMILWKIHVLNYSRAKLTIGFHNLKFFISESAWFIQYFFRNTNLTNIMKGRSSCNQSNICLCQRISICYFYQLSSIISVAVLICRMCSLLSLLRDPNILLIIWIMILLFSSFS